MSRILAFFDKICTLFKVSEVFCHFLILFARSQVPKNLFQGLLKGYCMIFYFIGIVLNNLTFWILETFGEICIFSQVFENICLLFSFSVSVAR